MKNDDEYRVGDLVVITGKLDSRIRDQKQEELTIGTLEQILVDGQVSVILDNGNIWVGQSREIAPVGEQSDSA